MAEVKIEPWQEGDLDLLRRLNAPEMMRHLGGPETDEKVVVRHRRYVDMTGPGLMYRVVLLPEAVVVGSIGYWEKDWQGATVWESGWHVLPGYQGRGIAVAATRAVVEVARAEKLHRYLHAFPSVENGPSNAVCRKAGFEFVGEYDFEYPPGHPIRCNDWRIDLRGEDQPRSAA
jgi:RimJ/RimL family protein N-acetyltransferase